MRRSTSHLPPPAQAHRRLHTPVTASTPCPCVNDRPHRHPNPFLDSHIHLHLPRAHKISQPPTAFISTPFFNPIRDISRVVSKSAPWLPRCSHIHCYSHPPRSVPGPHHRTKTTKSSFSDANVLTSTLIRAPWHSVQNIEHRAWNRLRRIGGRGQGFGIAEECPGAVCNPLHCIPTHLIPTQ